MLGATKLSSLVSIKKLKVRNTYTWHSPHKCNLFRFKKGIGCGISIFKWKTLLMRPLSGRDKIFLFMEKYQKPAAFTEKTAGVKFFQQLREGNNKGFAQQLHFKSCTYTGKESFRKGFRK